MIISEIFNIPCKENLTKILITDFFDKKKIKPVKWAITSISKDYAKILVSFEKKYL